MADEAEPLKAETREERRKSEVSLVLPSRIFLSQECVSVPSSCHLFQVLLISSFLLV